MHHVLTAKTERKISNSCVNKKKKDHVLSIILIYVKFGLAENENKKKSKPMPKCQMSKQGAYLITKKRSKKWKTETGESGQMGLLTANNFKMVSSFNL